MWLLPRRAVNRDDLRNSLHSFRHVLIEWSTHRNQAMDNLRWLSLLAEICLAVGMAGLFWPDKFLSAFEVLMFPWAATHRLVRAHSIAAIGAALFLVAALFIGSV
jgi:hypothetical protein